MGPQGTAVEDRLREGFAFQQQGALDAAAVAYRDVLAQAPDHFDALHLLGVIAAHSGRYGEAIDLIGRALKIVPTSTAAHYNLGYALDGVQDFAGAIASYDRAIALNPDHFLAHCNCAVAHTAIKQYAAAVAHFDQALALDPDSAEAHFNRAMAIMPVHGADAALANLDRAIALKPDFAAAYGIRAIAHRERKELAAARADCAQALTLNPHLGQAHNTMGAILADLGDHHAALASFETAVALDPDAADAYNNRGIAHFSLHDPRAALRDFDEALARGKDHPEYHHNRGMALEQLGRYAEAVASYQHARALRPAYPYLPGTLLYTKMRMCDWTDAETEIRAMSTAIARGARAAPPLVALAFTDDPALHLKAAATWVAAECPANPALGPLPRRPRGEKIRLGYFSMDFREHPVATLTAGLFETHDRRRFETFAFSYGPENGDAMRERLRAGFDHFLDVRDKSDVEVAAVARAQGIDIAIDLGGLTTYARTGILAARPAPVQASYIGYLGSMGADYIDYLIADRVVIPPHQRAFYTEKIAELPCFQANDRKRAVAARTFSRAALGLPSAAFVFCCFNNLFKILPATFASWMRILAQAPGSVLFLAGDNDSAARNLRAAAAAQGIDPARLVFGSRLPPADYLARYRAVDLFLDTQPYNAGTTASDALWMTVPVLTLEAGGYAGRMGASLLASVGLPELITRTPADYEATAVALAADPARMATIKNHLARCIDTGPLFDIAEFTRHIEAVFERMMERCWAGLPPEHLDVSP